MKLSEHEVKALKNALNYQEIYLGGIVEFNNLPPKHLFYAKNQLRLTRKLSVKFQKYIDENYGTNK